ncbi:FecCD family ABC transporter permease [Nocardioides sp. DS6]|uniref:FecCD family ABC transporter permease n=1 Tax=Nocardioides eburneus TaxID=3231482 RepID=A0ABV3SX02_9ACTN
MHAPADSEPDAKAVRAGVGGAVGRRTSDRRRALWIPGLALVLLGMVIVALGVGPVAMDPVTVARIVLAHLGVPVGDADWSAAQEVIVWNLRVPRVLLGAVVGAGLAAAGAALQAMVRNPLAEPYLLGISSGASTGAAALILFGFGVSAGVYSLTVSAFAGALVSAAGVFAIARSGGRLTSVRMLLSGVAVGYALSATTSFLLFAAPASDQAGTQAVLFFMLGSLVRAEWASLWVVAGVVVGMLLLLTAWGRRLDALTIGDDTSLSLGVSPTRLRLHLLVVVSLGVGALVAVSGGIGFVGLVMPHLGRRIVGAGHRLLVPVSALCGATFLVIADALARVVIAPTELPIGVLTAVVGVPFLLTLVRQLDPYDA